MCIENPWKFTQKLFVKQVLQGCKVQDPYAKITSNEQSKMKLENNSIYNSIKKIKYLGMYFTKSARHILKATKQC